MKLNILLILCLTSSFCYGQSGPDTTGKRSEELLKKNIDNTINDKERNELRTHIYSIQNTGFNLIEGTHDNKNALVYIDKALSLWITVKDTLNEANNRKYRGFLLGKLNRFGEGKADIKKAIYLYKLKKKDYGVAVSHFDFSKLY